MKYKMMGHWDVYNIRKMCIQHEFYTCGTEKQYMNMMNYVETHEPTTDAIEHVAKDIIKLGRRKQYNNNTFQKAC